MTQISPPAAQQYRAHIRWKFRLLARCYDLFDAVFLFRESSHPRRVLAAAIPNKRLQVLDVCTGTAGSALHIATRNDHVAVTGIDLSPDMLEVAEAKIRKRNIQNVEFRQMDATHLAFPDGSFDVATVSFGLHEFPADLRDQALREMVRVICPGGHLHVLDYATPRTWVCRGVFRAYLKLFEPGHVHEFLRTDWEQLLRQRGLCGVGARRLPFSQLISATKPT